MNKKFTNETGAAITKSCQVNVFDRNRKHPAFVLLAGLTGKTNYDISYENAKTCCLKNDR